MIRDIKLGYPGQNLTLGLPINQSCKLLGKDPQLIRERSIKLARSNLENLIKILEWNDRKGIKFFRISSDMFPHISNWRLIEDKSNWRSLAYSLDLFKDLIKKIGKFCKTQRLTFHPPPYTVLNMKSKFGLYSVYRELFWHAEFMRLAKMPAESVMILHGGGVYGDMKGAKNRWYKNFTALPKWIQKRIVIENDERRFGIHDILEMSAKMGVPVCLDLFHYKVYDELNPGTQPPLNKAYSRSLKTWKKYLPGVRPKLHISEQMPGGRLGAHSNYVETIPEWLDHIDLMIESKCKEKNVLKLIG